MQLYTRKCTNCAGQDVMAVLLCPACSGTGKTITGGTRASDISLRTANQNTMLALAAILIAAACGVLLAMWRVGAL